MTAAARQDPRATEAVLSAVYDGLKRIARRQMAGERRDHTLSATALVHELYCSLFPVPAGGADERAAKSPGLQWVDRDHFFRTAAESMRRILVDHARARNRKKRGGSGRRRVDLDALSLPYFVSDADLNEVLALQDVLAGLMSEHAEAGQITWLRFHAGLSVAQIADALGISEETVKRRWRFARAYLATRLNPDE